MTHLQLEAELSPSRFAELGRPGAVFRRHDGVCAVTSSFDQLFWPGRALYPGQRLRERVCIYAPGLAERWAICDAASFPINDLALHPREPWVAIATGSYDGGYLFQGELWLWNWQTAACFRLLSESRDVTRVRYLDDGRLALLMHPPDEGDFDGSAFHTYIGGHLDDLRAHQAMGLAWGTADPRLASFAPVDPVSLGFDAGELAAEARQASFDAAFRHQALAPRHRVWDLAWLDEQHVVAVHDTCHAEVWHTDGRLVWAAQGSGHGVQVLQHGRRSFVHVMERMKTPPWTSSSRLMEIRDGALQAWQRFEHTPLMSIDQAGRVLCRDTRRDLPRRSRPGDRIVDPSGLVTALDAGHYDCFNHHLRIDAAEDLYFLRGTPASSHEHKRLCRIDQQGKVHEMFDWDGKAGGHLMDTQACRLAQGGWVRVCMRYHPHDHGGFFIERLDERGRSLWQRPLEAPATALAVLPSDPSRLAYALTNGEIGVIDTHGGEPLWTQPLQLDGVASMALSLRARGERLAMGTLDGRVLLWRWSP